MGRGGDQTGTMLSGRRRRSTPAAAHTVLIVRDPDHELSFSGNEEVQTVSIDLGGSFDGIDNMLAELGREEAQSEVSSWLEQVVHLPTDHPGRRRVEQLAQSFKLPDYNPKPVLSSRKPTLIALRDPDYGTEVYTAGDLETIDLDLGADFDGLKGFTQLSDTEAAEYLAERRASIEHLPADHPARQALEEQLGYLIEARS